ncbi:hypothetical protein HDV05_003521 [Chytridiales sp. JEL 0842]|nr:hypothetical protein HDV05_003521 [Chytridiales sp. JEL 0842]
MNMVYQEYISDRNHIHMNATRWNSLTEFAHYLAREGICEVDETEKGLFISWIDKRPETLARQEAAAKKDKLEKSDEDREARLLAEQIEKAQSSTSTNETVYTELKRDSTEEPIKLKLQLAPSAAKGFASLGSKNAKPIAKPSWASSTKSKEPTSTSSKQPLAAPPKKLSMMEQIILDERKKRERDSSSQAYPVIRGNFVIEFLSNFVKTVFRTKRNMPLENIADLNRLIDQAGHAAFEVVRTQLASEANQKKATWPDFVQLCFCWLRESDSREAPKQQQTQAMIKLLSDHLNGAKWLSAYALVFIYESVRNGKLVSSSLLELLPQCLSLAGDLNHVNHGPFPGSYTGAEWRDKVLGRICQTTLHPTVALRLSDALADIPLSEETRTNFVSQLSNLLSKVALQDVPAVVRNLLIYTKKVTIGSRNVALDEIAKYFDEKDVDGSKPIDEQINRLEHLIIQHVCFVIKQDRGLAMEVMKWTKARNGRTLSTFTISLLLAMAHIHRFELEVLDFLKSVTLKQFKDFERSSSAAWILKVKVADDFLPCILPICQANQELKDKLILVLRKGMFSKDIQARHVAVAALVYLLKIAERPFAGSSQADSLASEHVEIFQILRRGFHQQLEIKIHLYEGFMEVLDCNPWMAKPCFDMLYQHLLGFYEADASVKVPFKFDDCIETSNKAAVCTEPIFLLLLVFGKALQLTNQQEASEDVDDGCAMLKSIMQKLSKAELADFDLSKDTEFNDDTFERPSASRNRLLADLMINCYKTMLAVSLQNTDSMQDSLPIFTKLRTLVNGLSIKGKLKKGNTDHDFGNLGGRKSFSLSKIVKGFELFVTLLQKVYGDDAKDILCSCLVDRADDATNDVFKTILSIIQKNVNLLLGQGEKNISASVELIKCVDCLLRMLKPPAMERDNLSLDWFSTIEKWIEDIVEKCDIVDIAFVKASLSLLLDSIHQTGSFDMVQVLAENIRRVAGLTIKVDDDETNEEDDRELLIVNDATISTVVPLILADIDKYLEDLLWCTLRLSQQLADDLAKVFRVVTALTKFKLASNQTAQKSFLNLMDDVSDKLRETLYQVVPILQQKELENIVPSKKRKPACSNVKKLKNRNKILQESKTMPLLIYQTEQLERYIIKLSKKSNVNLIKYVKRSTARDFKISEDKIAHSSDSSDDN